MPLDFFESGVANGAIQLANEKIRDLQQAAISEKWDATTAKYTIKEQDDYGLDTYHDIEVWIDYATQMTTRGLVNGDDFRKLMFESIDHPVKKGLYYQFDENYWLTYFTDKYSSLDVDIGVRRCNNVLKIVDPENGSIFCIPCVVDYDMTAPSVQVASSILTPNSHAIIKVQGNADTHRLFKLNTRYILGGRPFKLLAFQNTLINKELADKSTYLELDLFLDELHAKDDIENQVAYNGQYDYTIEIDAHDMELVNGATGTLNASVSLNGQEVNRQIVWESLSPDVVFIDEAGNYKVLGQEGTSCDIIAYIDGNPDVFAEVNIAVRSAETLKAKVIIEPSFDVVRQYETIEFEVKASYGSKIYSPDITDVEVDNRYLAIKKSGDRYELTGLNIAPETQLLKVHVKNSEPEFESNCELPIEVVSMMG